MNTVYPQTKCNPDLDLILASEAVLKDLNKMSDEELVEALESCDPTIARCFDSEDKKLIVQASNYDKDWFNEEFILWPMEKGAATVIAAILNDDINKIDEYFYKVVDMDYKLHIGMHP